MRIDSADALPEGQVGNVVPTSQCTIAKFTRFARRKAKPERRLGYETVIGRGGAWRRLCTTETTSGYLVPRGTFEH